MILQTNRLLQQVQSESIRWLCLYFPLDIATWFLIQCIDSKSVQMASAIEAANTQKGLEETIGKHGSTLDRSSRTIEFPSRLFVTGCRRLPGFWPQLCLIKLS